MTMIFMQIKACCNKKKLYFGIAVIPLVVFDWTFITQDSISFQFNEIYPKSVY